MDLEFFKGPRFRATGYFDMKVYQKPMNSYLYIPPFSAHTRINYLSVILSELKRYCIYCTAIEDYLLFKNLYYERLLQRGYSSDDLTDAFATPLDRQILRNNRNNKINKQKMMPPIFTAENTPRILEMNIAQLLRYTEDVYKDNTSHLFIPVRQPFVSLKRTTNLRDLLICSQFNGTIPACFLVPDW
jgi:hypothetical protein